MESSKITIYAAIAGNAAVAATKFIAAAISGSSAMLTEGIHSLVDTGDGVLLLVGVRASKKPPDRGHPFGHGKELYFYSLIVAVLIFGAGGGVSIYEGILHILEPRPVTNVRMNYIVLAIAAVFEGITWLVAMKGFLSVKGNASAWQTIRSSKDPTTFVVLFEDSAAMAGLLAAALGLYAAERFDMPMLDGVASVIIGLLLCLVAAVLIRESKGLLVGESASAEVLEAIERIVSSDPAVRERGRLLTMHTGPEDIIVNLDVEFRNELSASEISSAVDRLERAVRDADPRIKQIFIEAESLSAASRPAHRSVRS